MKKRIILFLLFFLTSAMPIVRPKTIEVDTETSQRYNEKHGVWENNIFITSEKKETYEDEEENYTKKEEKEEIKKIVFDETKYLFPLESKKISSGFGFSASRCHLGTDYQIAFGKMILASKNGEVVERGYKENLGNYIIIEYPQYIRFTYAHLSKVYVKEGDYVEIGQVVGRVGISGRSTGPHLHLEVTYQNVFMNPDSFFK
jgi:murein DD-endopeptidase MepM/ murein hydrolase activator NlpD